MDTELETIPGLGGGRDAASPFTTTLERILDKANTTSNPLKSIHIRLFNLVVYMELQLFSKLTFFWGEGQVSLSFYKLFLLPCSTRQCIVVRSHMVAYIEILSSLQC